MIGVDVRDAEVIADLSTSDGRAAMVDAVTEACGGVLDGLVAGAGVMDDALAIQVNYFGAVATLDGLRPALARGTDASAVAISSNSTTTAPGLPEGIVDACLAGDEARARRPRRERVRDGLRGVEARAGALGPPPRGHRRLDRRGHPPQRGRSRGHRYAR